LKRQDVVNKNKAVSMEKSFTDYAKKRIRYIHGLSSEYNGTGRVHMKVLLELAGKHAMEINELYRKKDTHFSTEVGDLIILCMEMLLERDQDLDGILGKCYLRYEKKLSDLMSGKRISVDNG
jgi:hypothetical protein